MDDLKQGALARAGGDLFAPDHVFSGLSRGAYSTIYCDPPWRFATWSHKGRNRSPDFVLPRAKQRENNPERHYPTMALSDIKNLPVGELAAPNCTLFMWAIDPMLPQAFEVAEAWSFTYKTVAFYWAKLRREGSTRHLLHGEPAHKLFPMGTGYWTRPNPEQCLLFTRGKPKRRSTSVRKLIIARRREHSRKPDEAITRVESLCDGPYVELFARSRRPGWESWGLESDRFGHEPDLLDNVA